jgi:hypothetical protein
MKKVSIVLLMGLAIGMTFMSCSKEEVVIVTDDCVEITGWSRGQGDNYFIYLGENGRQLVSYEYWLDVTTGKITEFCGE